MKGAAVWGKTPLVPVSVWTKWKDQWGTCLWVGMCGFTSARVLVSGIACGRRACHIRHAVVLIRPSPLGLCGVSFPRCSNPVLSHPFPPPWPHRLPQTLCMPTSASAAFLSSASPAYGACTRPSTSARGLSSTCSSCTGRGASPAHDSLPPCPSPSHTSPPTDTTLAILTLVGRLSWHWCVEWRGRPCINYRAQLHQLLTSASESTLDPVELVWFSFTGFQQAPHPRFFFFMHTLGFLFLLTFCLSGVCFPLVQKVFNNGMAYLMVDFVEFTLRGLGLV